MYRLRVRHVVDIYIYIYICIYIDIVPDVLDTSGESKNNIGPPEGGPKRYVVCHMLYYVLLQLVKCSLHKYILNDMMFFLWMSGCSVSTGGSHSHVYPYNRSNPSGPPRSKRAHKQHSSEALSTSQTVSKIYVALCLRSNALHIICV